VKNHRLNSLGWLALVGLISLLLCAPFFRVIYDLPDEGIFLRGAEMILQGKRLYGDFFGFLPPGSYLITAAAFGIGGSSIESARLLAILTILGIACFTFLGCRQVSRTAPLSALLVSGWVMMTQWHFLQVSHHWFTTFFSMAAAWVAFASQEQTDRRSLRWPILAGMAAGAATMCTPTCGAWAMLAAATAFIGVKEARKELIAFFSGSALVFVANFVLVIKQHTLAEAFDDDPFLILRWRGRERQALLGRLRELRAVGGPKVPAEERPHAVAGAALALAGLTAPGCSADRFWQPPIPLPTRPTVMQVEDDPNEPHEAPTL